MRVAVLGSGLAGLAAACDLADAGCHPLLLERRPFCGGKTYSFTDRETGEQIDNGQHIAMRCTTEYVAFLTRIGTAHLVDWQPRLRVPVIDADGRRSDLAAMPLPSPLHLAASFAAYTHLSIGDKLRIGRAIMAMRGRPADAKRHATISFGAWLREHGQSETGIRDFWDLIVVPALNCRCDDVSAAQALFVFREGFLKSATAAAIGVPRVGLSALHVEPAQRYIESRGGEVRTSASVERIDVVDGAVESVLLASGKRVVADAYVAALPPKQLLETLPPDLRSKEPFAGMEDIRTSPIVNLHLWFDAPIADAPFAAFTGCDLQWVFRPKSGHDGESSDEHVVISLSAAERFMPVTKQELVDLLLPQLRRALPGARSPQLLRSAMIKEPEATFVAAPGLRRPGVTTTIWNLVLAGAYTDTGWPATMESAVRSGSAAAKAVIANAAEISKRIAGKQAEERAEVLTA